LDCLRATALFALLIFVTCEKEADKLPGDNKVMLTLRQWVIQAIFQLNVNCSFVKASGQTITDHGFCYATLQIPILMHLLKTSGNTQVPVIFQQQFQS
jgi:hypothetical protein